MSQIRYFLAAVATATAFSTALPAHAAFVLEVDTDGADDGVLTYNPNFSFGPGTTTASQSSPSPAVGMTGGDSIFGGDAADPDRDQYLYSYTPAVDGDNINLNGQPLNDDGGFGGPAAGGSGLYDIYATWPFSTNVSGGPENFRLSDGSSDLFDVFIDQNNKGSEWVFVGQATLDANTEYQLIQTAFTNSFVSMRSAGVLFNKIPEPATALLALMAGVLMVAIRRR